MENENLHHITREHFSILVDICSNRLSPGILGRKGQKSKYITLILEITSSQLALFQELPAPNPNIKDKDVEVGHFPERA